jgi:hypothetical protein
MGEEYNILVAKRTEKDRIGLGQVDESSWSTELVNSQERKPISECAIRITIAKHTHKVWGIKRCRYTNFNATPKNGMHFLLLKSTALQKLFLFSFYNFVHEEWCLLGCYAVWLL